MDIVLDYMTIKHFLHSSDPVLYAGEVYGFDNDEISIVEKKIQKVWRMESLNTMRLSHDQKAQFANHIISLNIPNNVICGETNDEEYFDLVEHLARGHGIRRSNSGELYLLSAASKYCGHHNRKYPFYDNNNRQMLIRLGYPDCYQNFPQYVDLMSDVQMENGLESFTLRELDYYLWAKSKGML